MAGAGGAGDTHPSQTPDHTSCYWGTHACMATYLVFVNVIMDFYELGLRFRYLDPFTLYSLEVA